MDKTEEEKTLVIADRFVIAMFSPGKYNQLLKEKTGKIVKFMAVLLVLVTMVRYVVPLLGMIAGMGGIETIISKEVPDFSIKDGVFYYEDRIETEDDVNGIYVLVDTQEDKFTKADVPGDIVEAVMVSKTNILVYNQNYVGSDFVQELDFSDYETLDISKEGLIEHAGVIYAGIGGLVFVMYFVELGKYLLYALFFSLFMMWFFNMFMPSTSFGMLYKTTLYAQTTGTLLYSMACGLGSSTLISIASVLQFVIPFFIVRKVLFPVREL